MKATMDHVVSCSTFARLKQYHEASLVRFGKTLPISNTVETRRERQNALNEKNYTTEMLSRHELECPICRLERRNAA